MITRFTSTLLLLFTLSGLSYGANWYVNPASGNDNNPGTSTSAWKTLDRVLDPGRCPQCPGPGDFVYYQGGTYTPGQYALSNWVEARNSVRGSAGQPITITHAPGQSVLFDGQNRDHWIHFAPLGVTNFYIIVKDLEFTNFQGTPLSGWPRSEDNANDTWIRNIAFIGNTIRDGIASHAGAIVLSFAENYIIRGNRALNLGLPGNPNDPDGFGHHVFYMGEILNRGTVEYNYAEGNSGFGIHYYVNPGQPCCVHNVITRYNTMVNELHANMVMNSTNYNDSKTYNNTFYNDPKPYPVQNDGMNEYNIGFTLGGNHVNDRIFNNLGYSYSTEGNFVVRTPVNVSGMQMDYNMWGNLNNNILYAWGGQPYTSRTLFTNDTGLEANAKSGNPQFTNISARDFTLQAGSPAIDGGRQLTQATNSGSNATSLQVADAGYFIDGFGLVPGDTLQIGLPGTGGQTPVQIQSINYATNTITLATGRTWSNGTSVSLPYSGNAPDIGANESGLTTPPTPYDATWSFEQASGGSVQDTTGNGHDGTLVGSPTWGPGRVGTFALTLNGTNQTMTVPVAGLSLQPSKSYTWTFWVRPGVFTEWQALWTQFETPSARPYFAIYVHTTNDTDWGPVSQGVSAGWFSAGGFATAHTPNGALSPNAWSHVAVTYDNTKPPISAFTIYINGLPAPGGSSANGTISPINTTQATLGQDGWGDPHLQGSVDSGFIKDRAMSAPEILTLYRSEAGTQVHHRATLP